MTKFSTSLICCDLSDIKTDLDTLLELPEQFHYVHADFMDGHFVPRYGISPELIQWITKRYGSNITIDSHLMVTDPIKFLDVIAPYSNEVAFHYEATYDPVHVIQEVQKYNKKCFIAANLMTDIFDIANMMTDVDIDRNVLLMGISPGVLNTKSYFNAVENKIANIKMLGSCSVIIDGSVNFFSIKSYNNSLFNEDLKLICGNSSIFKVYDETSSLNRKELIKYNANRMMELL